MSENKTLTVRDEHLPVKLPGTWTAVGWIPPKNTKHIDESLFDYMVSRATTLEWALPFIIGDLLNWGEFRYGEKYAQAVQEKFNRKRDTLIGYCAVAGRIHISRRNENVTWGIHRIVAWLEPDEQTMFLALTEKHGWNVAQVSNAIDVWKRAQGIQPQPKVKLDFLDEEEEPAEVTGEDLRDLAVDAIHLSNDYKVFTAELEEDLAYALNRGARLVLKIKKYYWVWRRRAERLELICEQQEERINALEARVEALTERPVDLLPPMPPYKTNGFERIMDE